MNRAEKAFLAQYAIGVFSVDAKGRIWRHRIHQSGSKTGTPPTEKEIPVRRAESTAHKAGHLKVQIQDDGKKMMVSAHRVVWMLHNQSDIPEGLEINHKNGDPPDNQPLNLELVTPSGNVIHAMKVLGKMDRKGSKNSSAKLTEDQAREIRRLCEARTLPQRLIGLQFGVSTKTVQDIFYRRHWKNL